MTKKIAVIGEMTYKNAIDGFGEIMSTEQFLINPKDCKLVLFTGGADVDPSLYNNTSPAGLCHYHRPRDLKDMEVFALAITNEIKMTGICRGSQLLHVMAGGALIHHLDGHEGVVHPFGCPENDKIIEVNSYHHQMCVPFKDGITIGWSDFQQSEVYVGDGDKEINYAGPEVEAMVWPSILAAGVQYHPEWMSRGSDGYRWYHIMVQDLLNMSMDAFVNKYTGKDKEQQSEMD